MAISSHIQSPFPQAGSYRSWGSGCGSVHWGLSLRALESSVSLHVRALLWLGVIPAASVGTIASLHGESGVPDTVLVDKAGWALPCDSELEVLQ